MELILELPLWFGTHWQAIHKIGYTLLILMPWSDPIPMTRAWCLWEMLSTISTNVQLQCQMPKSEREVFKQVLIHQPNAPIGLRNFISLNNIPNIVRYLYEKPPYNKRKCGF